MKSIEKTGVHQPLDPGDADGQLQAGRIAYLLQCQGVFQGGREYVNVRIAKWGGRASHKTSQAGVVALRTAFLSSSNGASFHASTIRKSREENINLMSVVSIPITVERGPVGELFKSVSGSRHSNLAVLSRERRRTASQSPSLEIAGLQD